MSNRKYLQTHKWLRFSLDLAGAPFFFWILLGSAQSKCRHISGVPLKPSFAERLYHVNLARGALATTAIEGNTLSLDEVKARIEKKASLPKSREYMGKEIDNIVDAFNYVAREAFGKKSGRILSPEEIKHYNKLVLQGTDNLEERVVPGEFRTYSVSVGNYLAAPAEDCDYLISRLCEWINDTGYWAGLGDDNKVGIGVIKAIVTHLYFIWIHPFGDGNGRTARLIELKILLDSGVPAAAAHLLSNFYNETRSRYYSVLEKTSMGEGNPQAFLDYALQGFVDALDSHIDIILKEQVNVSWVNYVHELYKDAGVVGNRQRDLLLEITKAQRAERVITRDTIRALIAESKILSKKYGGSAKKQARDINALIKTGLLIRNPDNSYSVALNMLLKDYMSPCVN